METIHEPLDGVNQKSRVARREFLRLGAIGGAAVAAGAVAATWMPDLRQRGLLSADGVFDAASIAWADSLYKEVFPTSPLILNPFSDELPIPKAMLPEKYDDWSNWSNAPGPGEGQQNSIGNQKHQRWCNTDRVVGKDKPLVYKINVKVGDAFVHHVAGAADQLARPADGVVRRRARRSRRAPRTLPPQHDLRVQRHSSRGR